MSTFSAPHNSPEGGFLFVADDAQAAVWELDKSGNMVSEMNMGSDMMPQGAKIRKDLSSGYVGRRATRIRWESILREVVRLQYYQKNGDFGAKNRFLFLSWKWREIGLRCVKKYCGNTQFTLITSEYQNPGFES